MSLRMANRLQMIVASVALVLCVIVMMNFGWPRPPINDLGRIKEKRPPSVAGSLYSFAVVNNRTNPPVISGSVNQDEVFKLQRNEVSKMMNELKRELAMMSCELLQLKNRDDTVSASGGWCMETSFSNSGMHAFDKPLAEALSYFFKSKKVASFGDGPGDYKRYIDSTHRLQLYDAYDGAPYGPETSGGAVKFLDLTAPQYGLPLYDWVMSLEVAEHIPSKYESVYIDNVVRHAGTGIILSWAVPGQGGLSHVNNRPLWYVQNLLSEKGFEVNREESENLQNVASLPWLKRNVYVYYRRADSPASVNYT